MHKIDSGFYSLVKNNDKSLPWNSESPGSIVDRLSILSLKIVYLGLKAKKDIRFRKQVNQLKEQRNNLVIALTQLISDLLANKKQLKVSRDVKVY